MKIKILITIILTVFLTGCASDYYEDPSFGVSAVNAWFAYKNNKDDLGETRKKIENIDSIENVECEFIEKDNYKRYIFGCEITYLPIGNTIIPLSKDKKLNVYAVFMPNNDNTFDYKVYNSKYEKGIWANDPDINFGEKR